MSAAKVATAMTASFEPVDGGKATRIRTSVERGDAPDDFVSPAFRSKELTMALFGAAIEGRMDRLVAPPAATQEACQRLLDRMTGDNLAAGAGAGRPRTFIQAMSDGARNIVRLHAKEAELRRDGCNTNADRTFRTADERGIPHETAPADTAPPGSDLNHPRLPGTYASEPRTGTTAADRPMLDPTPAR